MFSSFRCDGDRYESLELGIYISSCTEIEHKKKYKMPIILFVTQNLQAWTARESLMLQLIKFMFKFLAQNEIKQNELKQNSRDTIKRPTRLKIYAKKLSIRTAENFWR